MRIPLPIELWLDDTLHRCQPLWGRWRQRLRRLATQPMPVLKGRLRQLLTTLALHSNPEARLRWRQLQARHAIYGAPLAPGGQGDGLRHRVLIIAEATIPQCLRYRVLQRQEMLASLQIPCTWVSWHDQQACLQALQTHRLVIFYRTPWLPGVQAMAQEARRLGLPTYWEVDDLVFDRELLRQSPTQRRLDRATFRGILRGATLYASAMRAADATIASTPALAAAMQAHGADCGWVVPNALDAETLAIAQRCLAARQQATAQGPSVCRIGYGSGTNTHDLDVLEATEALLALLRAHPGLRLRLVGPLELPEAFAEVAAQIERYPMCSYANYLALLAECDIAIAPLQPGLFNDCKSNIKALEAAALQVPIVCSPRAEFAALIQHGRTGFLADTPAQWHASLLQLIEDPPLRVAVGRAASAHVLAALAPEAVAAQKLAFLGDQRPRPSQQRPRLLSVNVFYAPQAFGGATILAEALNGHLSQLGWDVAVFTTIPDAQAGGKPLHRYQWGSAMVFGVPFSAARCAAGEQSSAAVREAFAAVLDAVDPQLVHIHCLQGLGLTLLELCVQRQIPYVITLHDAWWLCPRQFMLTPAGEYCGQTRIDTALCGTCTGTPQLVLARWHQVRAALEAAAALLAPSQFFGDLFASNGFTQVRLNRNGVLLPAPQACRPQPSPGAKAPVRFAYLGGNTPIKGFPLIQQVFRRLPPGGHRLILVDNTLNLGHASYFLPDLLGLGDVQVVPAFSAEGLDAFYAGVDVLLFPTQWKESFGLAIREALARGIWVICSDAGGTVEDLVDGRNGRILPFPPQAPQLAAAVQEAIHRRHQPEPTPVRSQAQQAQELDQLLRGVLSGSVASGGGFPNRTPHI